MHSNFCDYISADYLVSTTLQPPSSRRDCLLPSSALKPPGTLPAYSKVKVVLGFSTMYVEMICKSSSKKTT